jgi:hypothetical protein
MSAIPSILQLAAFIALALACSSSGFSSQLALTGPVPRRRRSRVVREAAKTGDATGILDLGTDGTVSPTELTPEYVAAFRESVRRRKRPAGSIRALTR